MSWGESTEKTSYLTRPKTCGTQRKLNVYDRTFGKLKKQFAMETSELQRELPSEQRG
tara:strand:- start:36354 stop:36524 length:171 start_codon:yes stop_codon:yes gene_type:complete